MNEQFPADPESGPSSQTDDTREQRYFSAMLYGGMAAVVGAIGGAEEAIGAPEVVADGTFLLSGALAVAALAALVAERVMSRNQ